MPHSAEYKELRAIVYGNPKRWTLRENLINLGRLIWAALWNPPPVICKQCGWAGSEHKLDAEGECPRCGSYRVRSLWRKDES